MSDAMKMVRLDILSMKVYLKNYLIVLIYPLIFSWWSPGTLAIMCSFMFAVMCTSVFSVQEKNHLDRLYGVLHISKRALITGRYLFAWIHLAAALLLSLPIYMIISGVTGKTVAGDELVVAAGMGFLFFWLLTGIQIPIFFRLGYTKARFWSYAPFLFIALIPVLVSIFPGLASLPVVTGMLRVLESAGDNPWAIFVVCIAGGLVFFFGSLLVSVLVYRRRI